MQTPADIEQVLEQMRIALVRWHEADTLGEIAIVRGGVEYQVEERPKRRHKPIKRESQGMSVIDKSGHCPN